MPGNPSSLEDFQEIAEEYTKTLSGEEFPFYDSLKDVSYKGGRVIIFTTKENLNQKLCSLVFVPEEDVVHTFEWLLDKIPEDFLSVADYFDVSFYNNNNYFNL